MMVDMMIDVTVVSHARIMRQRRYDDDDDE